jgi:hypothetical protein
VQKAKLIKGTVSQDFCFWFFHESVYSKPLIISLGCFEFFRKFSEILAAQGAPPVQTTPVANEKNLQSEKFALFLLDTFR